MLSFVVEDAPCSGEANHGTPWFAGEGSISCCVRCTRMEREGLKRDFGDRLMFHGGVDNQYTLAFGSVEEVRQEVIDNIRILGAGGGYILGPCHNIQPISPPENVVAMYECGWGQSFTV